MRVMFILRGVPASGKDTFIDKYELRHYAVSSDDIRLLYHQPYYNVDGSLEIYQGADKHVWKTFFEVLEGRMKNGEFVVVNSTNTKASDIITLKSYADKYSYKVYCIDFSNVDIEIVKKRNREREPFKTVPEKVIDRMYNNLKINSELPCEDIIRINGNDDNTIKLVLDSFKTVVTLDHYEKVSIIGDIHGCFTALSTFLEGGIKDDQYYVFLGDYLDRGIENVETLKFLLSIYKKPNVTMLEGNHEAHLRDWSRGFTSKSKEFETYTKLQLQEAEIDKDQVADFYSKLKEMFYFKYGEEQFFCCHGGMVSFTENPLFIPAKLLIKGVGDYNDVYTVDKTWDDNNKGSFQLHGHRNPKNKPFFEAFNSLNLEGDVERGGSLRIVEMTLSSEFAENKVNAKYTEIENDVYSDRFEASGKISKVIDEFRNDPYINERKFGNISSFNFSRKAFYKNEWNERTITARGLYIDTVKNKIVARGYNKFFNIGELPSTQFEVVKNSLTYPVAVYRKENGFLGLVSYDEYTDDLFISTKSDMNGDTALMLKETINTKLTDEDRRVLLDICKQGNTVLFECIDKRDPHIVKYFADGFILLDVVKNCLNYEKAPLPYFELIKLSKNFSGFVRVKRKTEILASPEEFETWYKEVSSPDLNRHIEGYVIEDNSGHMYKVKTFWYQTWKKARTYLGKIKSGKEININSDKFSSNYIQIVVKPIVEFMMDNKEEIKDKNIIEVRELMERKKWIKWLEEGAPKIL